MRIYLLFLLALFLFACSEPNQPGSLSQPHSNEWSLPHSNERPSSSSSSAQAAHRVIESKQIKGVLKYIDNETLGVFDVDATLVWVPGHTWPHNEVSEISLAEGANTKDMWDE